jgi:Tfp pilus assembly protein PilF
MTEPWNETERAGGSGESSGPGRSRRLLSWAVVIALAAGATWALAHYGFGRDREWTTSSREALAAFNAGLDGRMRFYEVEASASFRRAIELDPGFASARLMLAQVTREPEERKRLLEELGAADLSRLTPRERFLIESGLSGNDPARRREIISRALAEHPEDPWVLFVAAAAAWDREDWREAERLYHALLEVDPNWVMAHNHLGYLAMSQAQFADAEEHFRTYAFVAPDQANPHDSLGELLALLGRYDEAKSELELALAEKPDFCASYVNLVGIAFAHADSAGAASVFERAKPHCPEPWQKMLDCEIRMYSALFDRDYDRPWREGFAGCGGDPGKGGPLLHRLALLAGRAEVAAAEEEALRREIAASRDADRYQRKRRSLELTLRHEEGVRAILAGHIDEAVAKFSEADERAFFWGRGEGMFKLFNLANLALALERANDLEGSRRALDRIGEVNPQFAALYPRMIVDVDSKR